VPTVRKKTAHCGCADQIFPVRPSNQAPVPIALANKEAFRVLIERLDYLRGYAKSRRDVPVGLKFETDRLPKPKGKSCFCGWRIVSVCAGKTPIPHSKDASATIFLATRETFSSNQIKSDVFFSAQALNNSLSYDPALFHTL
jgi:hypothetical protein